MKVTFIQPAVGKKVNNSYAKTWCMEPLSIAVLSALTPANVERVFFDDRIEPIRFDESTDIAAISVETYTAKRAYEIAKEYRSKKIKVVMGGFHATLATDEVGQHADSVVIGEAELTWPQLLDDFQKGSLKKEYRNDTQPEFKGIIPDRSIFENKKYLLLGLIETSRGCLHNCEFCSIYGFYDRKYRTRPIEDIVTDIRQSGKKSFFFVDDNIAMDRKRTIDLCSALKPLKINWFGQAGIHISNDTEMLQALKESGCIGFLIGFESFNNENLDIMGKKVNLQFTDYKSAIKRLRAFGFMIYGTFVFGYPGDTVKDFEKVLNFSLENKLYMNAFNHLVPFPGTPLYYRLIRENRMISNQWWLMDNYKFGDVVFHPGSLSAHQLSDLCYQYRLKFFRLRSIFYRAMDIKANCNTPKKTFFFFLSNFMGRGDVKLRQGLPVGKGY